MSILYSAEKIGDVTKELSGDTLEELERLIQFFEKKHGDYDGEWVVRTIINVPTERALHTPYLDKMLSKVKPEPTKE